MRHPTPPWLAVAVVALVALGTFSCQKKAKPSTVPETATPAVTAPAPPAHTETAPPVAEPFPKSNVETAPVEPSIDELNRQGVLRTIYFAYDSNALDDSSRTTLQSNASWLKSHSGHPVEIGGHCDERGSIGYNIALGDRRAGAVKDYLTGLGVTGSQLVAVSYGEEKPAVPGHDEAAWSKNRRAEFTIKP